MNRLELFMTPTPLENLYTYEALTLDTSKGWRDGLTALGVAGDIESSFNIKVKKPEPSLMESLTPWLKWKPLDDIDFMMKFSNEIKLVNSLPRSGYIIKPSAAANWDIKGVVVGMKVWSEPEEVKGKVDQFVKLYKYLLDPRNRGNNKFEVDLTDWQSELLWNTNTPLCFVFNGWDCVNAWKYMSKRVGSDGCIHGHRVCVIFCKSDELTKWTAEIKLEAYESKLEAAKSKLEAAKSKLQAAEIKLDTMNAQNAEMKAEKLRLRQELERLEKTC